MSDRPRIGLDNPSFAGRLRTHGSGQRPSSLRLSQTTNVHSNREDRSYRHRVDSFSRLQSKPISPRQPSGQSPTTIKIHEVRTHDVPSDSIELIKPQPYALPAKPKLQPTKVLRRQSVAKPTLLVAADPSLAIVPSAQAAPQKRHKRNHAQIALMTMAAVVFLVGIFVSLITLQTNHSAKSQVAALAQKTDNENSATTDSSAAVPSENKPSSGDITTYQVAPNLPKYLKISKIGVNARIKPLGVTSHNELMAPYNIYDTGWYDASAKPGDLGSNGAILIDGHVHGPTLPGVFMNIKNLAIGDTIQIVRGDNKVFTYVVKKVQNYDANSLNMGMTLTSIQPGEPGLNLITCGGPFDRASGEYTQRTVVFAVQQN